MSRSAQYVALINTRRWRLVRSLTLSREPLCRRCREQGRVTAARQVHHIIPLESIKDPARMERLAYSAGNLMPVCEECHRAIHQAMKSGGQQERRRRAAAESGEFVRHWLGLEPPPGGDF